MAVLNSSLLPGIELAQALESIRQRSVRELDEIEYVVRRGKINQFIGLIAEARGPQAFLGERCIIRSGASAEVEAEVVGIKNDKVMLMPFGDLRGVRLGSDVIATGKIMSVPVGQDLVGRVIDAFGNPLDGGKPLHLTQHYEIYKEPINPLNRPVINRVLETGVRSIDALLTIGRGQRMGIFAGSGVGKSSLLGMINRHVTSDINVVALIGERGREVKEFVESISTEEGLGKTIVVVATSDQPALIRTHAAWAATAIAEYFSDQGMDVVLTLDSITRFAMAQREIGLAIGEPPTARGYTPSVFALLPRLLERCGTNRSGGSITAFYTVLVESDDMNDPLADSIRAILDGGIVLSRELANQRHYPAIDVLRSSSRLFNEIVQKPEQGLARKFFENFSRYENSKELISLGAYQKGSNPEMDKVIALAPALNAWLQQGLDQMVSRKSALIELKNLLS
jgi:flagellum-specific ATP synthase